MVIVMLNNRNVETFKTRNCKEHFVIDLAYLEKCVDDELYSECKCMFNKISKMVKVEMNQGKITFRRLQFTKTTKNDFNFMIERMIVMYFDKVKKINPDRFDVLHGTEFFSTQQCVELININVKWFQNITEHQAREFAVCLSLLKKDYTQFFFIDPVNCKLLCDRGLLKKEDYENIVKWEKQDDMKLFGGLEDNYNTDWLEEKNVNQIDFNFVQTKHIQTKEASEFHKRRVEHFENEVRKRQRV